MKKILILIIFGLFLSGCNYKIVKYEDEKNNQQTKSDKNECTLPDMWEEVGFIHKDCKLNEVEKSNNHSDTFSQRGGNGSFDYCNTLIFIKYSSLEGDVYTYTKERYKHYPNSEVGEYRIPKLLYEEITNSKKCNPTEGEIGYLNDDDISSQSFPSRNFKLDENYPCYFASFFNRHYNEGYEWTGEKKEICL